MRVQPHLPSKPLLTMVMSRSGLAFWACSAANSPAPPLPRIRMSVLRRSTFMRASEYPRQEYEGDDRGYRGGDGRQLLLSVVPIEILDHQNAQAAEQMNREQEDQTAFGKFHQRLIGPAQKALELRFAVDGEAQRQKMQRQENRQSETRQPMHQGGDPQRAAAMHFSARHHDNTTANTARAPSAANRAPNRMAKTPARRSVSGDHSVKTLRTPIDAWIDAAATNSP